MNTLPEDLFKATSAGIHDTLTAHTLAAAFQIPEYQREYTWDAEKVDRLLQDCFNGFARLSETGDSFTFLGNIIPY